MATVSFIPYARQSGGTLSAVCKYVMQEAKTVQADGLQLTSGLNCSPQFAAQEFGQPAGCTTRTVRFGSIITSSPSIPKSL